MMRTAPIYSPLSLMAAPVLAVLIVSLLQAGIAPGAWPWWWSGVLALAWAPLLWLPVQRGDALQSNTVRALWWSGTMGLGMVTGLSVLACLAHSLPLGIKDVPYHHAGVVSLLGMGVMYLCLVQLQRRPQSLVAWRRWSYAGFYVDEFYTRLALRLWPARWVPAATVAHAHTMVDAKAVVASK